MTEPSPRTPGDPDLPRAELARRRAATGLAVAGALAVLLTLAVARRPGQVPALDEALTRFTRGWADSLGWPVDLAHAIGLATAPIRSAVFGAIVVVLLLVARRRAAAGWVALSGIAGVLTAEAIKALIGRQRPPGAEQFESDLDKSFPSGHAMVGIYLYLVIGLVCVHLARASGRRWLAGVGWLLVAVGPLIGASRLVLGVHWPSDLVAGWAFGSVVALGSALLLWWPLDRGWSGDASAAPVTTAPATGTTDGAPTPALPPDLAPDELP